MNQVMNVYVSTTVYAYLNITPQRDSGLYLKQDVSVRENPVEIVVVIKKINKERNNNKKKKSTQNVQRLLRQQSFGEILSWCGSTLKKIEFR